MQLKFVKHFLTLFWTKKTYIYQKPSKFWSDYGDYNEQFWEMCTLPLKCTLSLNTLTSPYVRPNKFYLKKLCSICSIPPTTLTFTLRLNRGKTWENKRKRNLKQLLWEKLDIRFTQPSNMLMLLIKCKSLSFEQTPRLIAQNTDVSLLALCLRLSEWLEWKITTTTSSQQLSDVFKNM